MSNSQTTTPVEHGPKAPTPQMQALLGKRDAAIEAALAEQKVGDAHRAKGDKKGSLSSGGRLANRTREVREVEADLAMIGFEVEPWQLPRTGGADSKLAPMTQAEIEEKLGMCWKAFQTGRFESTKSQMDKRIQALLIAAEKRGYTVKDPRK